MASLSQPESCAKNVAENERSDPHEWPASDQTEKRPEQEYDFVEDLPQDFFCPVTFELLRDPQLTTCCGHLLSRRVVTKLQQEGKPCPMCKDPSFPSVPNKHFKRKVEELKVRCFYERDGCKWEGELGNLDHHSKSCSKRPWQCQHCDFRGTYDNGTTDHLPNCTKYPEPCPNQCDIGTVPHCDMEKHLTECPLQLVECEFAQAGCQEKIPRQELSRHMEEGAQRHLLSMSLLNLSLTRELHQKVTEKDQQIAELQEQLQEQSRKLEEQFQEIKNFQEQGKQTNKQLQKQLESGLTGLQGQIDGKVTDLQQNIQQQVTGVSEQLERKVTERQRETANKISGMQKHLETRLTGFQGRIDVKVKDLQQKIQQQITGAQGQLERKITEQHKETEKQISGMQAQLQDEKEMASKMQENLLKQIQLSLFRPPFEFTLTRFSVHKGGSDEWYSDPFYSHPGGYKFKLNIDTNGSGEAQGTHISAWFFPQKGEHDDNLSWPVQVIAHLQLLNQRGDHGHMVASAVARVNKRDICREIARKFIAHSELGYNAAKGTQYLKDDCLRFRLYLKATPQT